MLLWDGMAWFVLGANSVSRPAKLVVFLKPRLALIKQRTRENVEETKIY